MKKKWTRPIAFFLSVMMVMTCLPLSAFAADGGAGSAGTQTYRTPEEATADGKIVKYFGFSTNPRCWESTKTPCALHLYQPESGGASAATDTPLVLDTNGIDDNAAYVIISGPDAGNDMGVLHIKGDATDQGKGDALKATVYEREHLFVFENVEGGWAIRYAGADPAKYLSLDAAPSGNQRAFKAEKTIFYITPAAELNDGTYYIWTATDRPVDVVNPPAQPETSYEYKLDTDGIDSGATYAIYSNGSDPTKNRILYHTGTGKTDHVPCGNSGEVSDTLQLFATFPDSRQLWVITAVDGAANGYTVQSVDSGRYLALSGVSDNGSDTSETPVTLTIVTDPVDGTITISNDGNKLCFDPAGKFPVSNTEEAAPLRLFKKTEAPFEMAETDFHGTSQNQPMVKTDTHGKFRIPSLITLDNGWLMASSDLRWTVTRDAPANLDTIVSISEDGGNSWSWEIMNYFSDYIPTSDSVSSASFIDPSVVQASGSKIWMIVDALPAYGGNASGTRMLPADDPANKGFDDQGRMLVGHITDVTTDTYHPEGGDYFYEYYVDLYGTDGITANDGASFTVEGREITLYPICKSADDSKTGYYVDAFVNTYYDYGTDDGGVRPILAQQQGSAKFIHNNLFYLQSEWKVPCTFYLMIRSADITADGLAWSDPVFANVKKLRGESDAANVTNERFVGVCPGRGTVKHLSDGTERIIFPLYDNSTGTEKASVIYSDDGGETWNRGERAPNGESDKSSESQIVVLPVSDDPADGTFLRMYSRNGGNNGKYISYADSTDNGVTWTAEKFDLDLFCGHDTMVSFINIDGYVIGPDGKAYGNLILASYPMGDVNGTHGVRRTNGTVRIGSYDAGTGTVQWLNRVIYGGVGIRYPFNFTYSCLTQLPDGNGDAANSFAILYEDETRINNQANLEIVFDTFTVEDVLGADWSWRLTLDGYVQPDPIPVGDDVYTPEKAEHDGKKVKYLSFVGGDSSSRYWGVAGAARSAARIELYNAGQADGSWAVTLDEDGVAAGSYVINFDTGNGRRQAVMHYVNEATNQCTEAGAAHNASDADLLHLFDFAKAAGSSYSNAFTIKAHSADKYLSLDASGSNRAFKDTPTTFYITPADRLGSYHIWVAEDPVDYSTLEPAQVRFTGTGSDEPMDNTDVGTDFFRIPAITTLSNGWLVAAADVRWTNWRDCQNQEVIVSVSKDGETWDWDIVDYLGDLANSVDSDAGAHFIDPALAQGADGTVYLVADISPAGISDIADNIAAGTGFDSQGRLLLYKDLAGAAASRDVSEYTYYVDLNGSGDYHPICAADGDAEQGVYVDAELNLYTRNGAGEYVPVLCQQMGSEKSVQNNLFFLQSDWKVFPTMYISLRTATVGADGLEWGKLRLLNVKNIGETFLGVCPGRGFVADNGRIIVPVYDNITGTERASVIYSDDNGKTWTRGGRTNSFSTNINRASESQIIRLPDGTLRMYSRNQGSTYVGYSDSTDNGATWGTTYADTGLRTGSNCMFSVINVAGTLKDPNGESYENVVMASYPEGNGAWSDWNNRSNGCLRLGYITGSTEDGWTVNWLGEPYPYSPGQFSYSCLTQYSDENGWPMDKFGALYEPGHEGTVNVRYGTYTAANVLGAGWTIHKHTEDSGTVTREAACTEDGVKTFNCSVCGEALRVESIPATGHTEVAVERIAPTCTETGLTEGTKCSVCDETLTRQEVIPATGHTVVIDPAVPATETSTGLTEGSHCSVCNAVLGVQEVIPVLTPTTPANPGGMWTPVVPGTSTTTTTNPDGSTMTTVTDNRTGTVTETTEKPDGSTEVVETKKDGTVTATATDPEGGKVEKITTPDEDVTITVTDSKGETLAKVELPAEVSASPIEFVDVPEGHWAESAINQAAGLGLVQGVGGGRFDLNGDMKRGDLAVVLYNLSNGSKGCEVTFDDVPADMYYADGVAWAARTGVVNGFSETEFGPENNITREQLAVMLYRYAALLKLDTTVSGDGLDGFNDGSSIDSWAEAGMAWCVENGIIQGKGNGILAPDSNATRAEVTVMLQRFMNLLK